MRYRRPGGGRPGDRPRRQWQTLRVSSSPSPAQLWIEGARPRTLPAAVAPVLAGTGVAVHADGFVWWKALLALGVSLALQIGVNYANDYSDGVRGTDAERVGPLRLVGSGHVAPGKVKAAALGFLGLGGLLGVALAATTTWWLLLVGAVAIAAAWTYTGGSNPYGYRALGEVSVFVFFGLVAVVGTTFVQTEEVGQASLSAAIGIGALACAILVANNLRDIPTDREVGKRTLAVVLGDRGSRRFYVLLITIAAAAAVWCAAVTTWWALLALVSAPLAARAVRVIGSGVTGRELIAVLRDSGLLELVYAVGLAAGLVIGSL